MTYTIRFGTHIITVVGATNPAAALVAAADCFRPIGRVEFGDHVATVYRGDHCRQFPYSVQVDAPATDRRPGFVSRILERIGL